MCVCLLVCVYVYVVPMAFAFVSDGGVCAAGLLSDELVNLTATHNKTLQLVQSSADHRELLQSVTLRYEAALEIIGEKVMCCILSTRIRCIYVYIYIYIHILCVCICVYVCVCTRIFIRLFSGFRKWKQLQEC